MIFTYNFLAYTIFCLVVKVMDVASSNIFSKGETR